LYCSRGKWFSVVVGIRFDRREYHAAQSGRFVARPSWGQSNFQAPSGRRRGRILASNSAWQKLGWGDFLPNRSGFIFGLSCLQP